MFSFELLKILFEVTAEVESKYCSFSFAIARPSTRPGERTALRQPTDNFMTVRLEGKVFKLR
jgi:hypothetical protein